MAGIKWLAGLVLLAVLPVTALPAAPTAPAVVQSYETYKSWLAACDNTLDCVAKGFDQAGGGGILEIERPSGPGGVIKATIVSNGKFGLGQVRIDGKPVRLSPSAWQVTADDDLTTATSRDMAAITALVSQLRNGTTLALGGDAQVPLDGFAAALLRIDDRQGRIGGVTSLARPGPLPASRVPAALPVPRIPVRPILARLAPGEAQRLVAAVRAGQRAVFAKEDCETDIDPQAMAPEAYALDARQALVLVPCIMGAYQGSSLAFVAARGGGGASRRLVLRAPYLGASADDATVTELTEASFDPRTGTLGVVAKGRGLADCGMSASWVWDGGGFVLSQMALQQGCDGTEPGDWPTLFRSAG